MITFYNRGRYCEGPAGAGVSGAGHGLGGVGLEHSVKHPYDEDGEGEQGQEADTVEDEGVGA